MLEEKIDYKGKFTITKTELENNYLSETELLKLYIEKIEHELKIHVGSIYREETKDFVTHHIVAGRYWTDERIDRYIRILEKHKIV